MKKLLLLGFSIIILFSCQHTEETGHVGQQLLLNAKISDEDIKYDYVWKIIESPESSELVLSEIKFSSDESNAIFIPDVPGQYSIQVTVWKYNDKLGSHIFNYNIVDENLASTNQQSSEDAWLDESVGTPTFIPKPVQDPSPEVDDKLQNIITEKTQSKIERVPNPRTSPIEQATTTTAKYTIQVLATSYLNKAMNLVNQLSAVGYYAYFIEQLDVNTYKKLYKVRVGKYFTRQDALQEARSIEVSQNLSTWVTKY